MSVMDEFVKIAVQDIKGKPKLEEAKQEDSSPARADFAKIATSDLQGADRTVSKEELENAFHKSIVETTDTKEMSVALIEKFKQEADSEVKQTLSKLLRGLK